ncbi:MAG: peptidoglycan-binding protein [Alphaproteobacteria bacterium]|nr:peptidoglycan-binding protein [Alphaproteobacteria bacterium]
MRLALGTLLLLWAAPMAFAQSAGEVERCFQNPANCPSGAPAPAPAPAATAPAPQRPTASPDYATVLKSSEAERRKLQESLHTLDKYNGPIDGNLQSEASEKAIADWQKGHGLAAVGKLTPTEAVTLNNEAARVPIKRINPTAATNPPPPPAAAPSNAEALKALRTRLAERHRAAEPKAQAAVQALVRDLTAYMAAGGKGVAGEQFAGFAKWYADTKAAGRGFGDIKPTVEDYGDAKSGDAVTAEVSLQSLQGDTASSQCMMFAWIEGSPRKETQTFSCDDVAGIEKWKTGQSLKSAWR